ncbi:MAG: hypothetical protein LCH93_10040 [Proteobacteria bacterium]|nr:hypothetical protein [Pseudomonadota bacterium]
MLEGLQLLDTIDEDRGLRIQDRRLLGDSNGLREIAVQGEMDLAFPVVHLGIDRTVSPRLVEDCQGLVELAGVGKGESVLPQ